MVAKKKVDQVPVSDQLHPIIYKVLAGLAIWLVVSAWIFFSQGGYLGLDLGIVSALVFIIIAIPTVIYRAGRSSLERPIEQTLSARGFPVIFP